VVLVCGVSDDLADVAGELLAGLGD